MAAETADVARRASGWSILGFLIWAHWPSTSIWVIGTLIGISLIFSGVSRVMLSAAARRTTTTTV